MSAQPKNKITRVEQGKRRAGNTPKLNKDAATAKVALHKKTLFGKISKLFPATKAAEKTTRVKTSKSAK